MYKNAKIRKYLHICNFFLKKNAVCRIFLFYHKCLVGQIMYCITGVNVWRSCTMVHALSCPIQHQERPVDTPDAVLA